MYRKQAKRTQTNVVLGTEHDAMLAEIVKRTGVTAVDFFRAAIRKEHELVNGMAQSVNIAGKIVDGNIVLNQYGIDLLKEAMTRDQDTVKLVHDINDIEIVGSDNKRE